MSFHVCVEKKNLKPSSPMFVSMSLKRSGSSVWIAGSVRVQPTPCRSQTRKRPRERSNVKCEKACAICMKWSSYLFSLIQPEFVLYLT
jgi:hypothetical protein